MIYIYIIFFTDFLFPAWLLFLCTSMFFLLSLMVLFDIYFYFVINFNFFICYFSFLLQLFFIIFRFQYNITNLSVLYYIFIFGYLIQKIKLDRINKLITNLSWNFFLIRIGFYPTHIIRLLRLYLTINCQSSILNFKTKFICCLELTYF